MIPRVMVSILLGATVAMAGTACKSKNTEEHGKHKATVHEEHDEHDENNVLMVQLSPEAAARIHIRIEPVQQRALAGILITTGRVAFNQDRLAHVSPRVPGRVYSVQATLGDTVEIGQTLAIIDSIELGRAKSEFLAAKVQLDLARITLKREEALLADQITSQQSVLEASSSHKRVLAEYQTARQQLRLLGLSDHQVETTSAKDPLASLWPLTSFLSGTVVEKHVSLGEIVSPDRNLFTVADLSQVWIWIDIYERDLARVHLEDDVAVRVDAFSDRIFEGKVAYIRSQVDPATRTAQARIDVPNLNGHLRPGMFAKVTVTDPHGPDGKAATKTLVVPASAIQRDGQQHIAFVPGGERKYERRVVTLGRQTDAFVEVKSGLHAGESVVVEGTFILKSEAAKESMGGGHSH